MTDKIRIVGAFADDVVGKVEEFAKSLKGVESVQVLRDGVALLTRHADDESTEAAAPAETAAAAETATTAPTQEAQTEAPPTEEGTTSERRTGPADRREAQAQA